MSKRIETDFSKILSQESEKEIRDPDLDNFINFFETNVHDEEMLFKYIDTEEEEEEEPTANYHPVYQLALDFIEELKKPILLEKSKNCYNCMKPIFDVINSLLEYQERISYDDDIGIENWRNVMIQCLTIADSYIQFYKEETNTKCIEIAESLLKFAFNIELDNEHLKSKIFSVLPEFRTFLTSSEQIFSLESSTGSGKTRCLPFFLSIRSYREGLIRPFIIMTQPSTNIIYSKEIDFKNILKNVTILTAVDEIIQYGMMKEITQPVLCLLTPYNALILIEKAKSTNINLFDRARWVLDEVHDRTVFIDTMIGFLHQEIDKVPKFPCQITLMTATMDKSIQRSLGKDTKSIELKNFAPYPVEEKKDFCDNSHEIPSVAANYTFEYLNKMRNGKLEPGHILVFVAGNADCQSFMRELWEINDKNNNEENTNKIICINANFNEFSTVDSVIEDIEREAFDPNNLYILPIQLAGYVGQVQKIVAQNPLPPRLKNVVKIIISTNIVESSVTILDLAVVIDTGLYNRAKFDPETEITKLTKEMISQKMATQRRGRVGRTRKGAYVGIKISDYQDIDPPIKTNDLSSSLLSLRSIGIKLENVKNLPDQPDVYLLEKNIADLKRIGALDYNGDITEKGKEINYLSSDFSPFFASILLDIRAQTKSEYHEILSALIILIMTSQKLIQNQNCKYLEQNFDPSSDIITILKTFNQLFEFNFQEQKENCTQYGFEQNAFTRLVTSFSNYIHKVFKRDPDDHGFLGRHVQKVRELISTINLMNFINFVINTISKTKQTWIYERIFSFKGISGLSKIPSVNAYNEYSQKNVIIGSRPGWRGLECDSIFYVFSLTALQNVIFGAIVHRCQINPMIRLNLYKCVSFKFNENIDFPFFNELLNCLNSNGVFLPMNYQPTQASSLSTLTYQSSWRNENYMSICCHNDPFDINIMKKMISSAKMLMPFVGNSMLVEAPEVKSFIEIYSIGGSRYSTKIYSLNHHPHVYQLNEQMFNFLSNHLNVLAKTDSSTKISILMSYIMNPPQYNVNPFFVISNNVIIGYREIDWENLIKVMLTNSVNKIDPFIEEINSLAPNIISAQEKFSYLYCFLGNKFTKLSKVIQNFLKTNFKNDIIVERIPLQKVFYGEDIDYDIESKKTKDEIFKIKSQIKSIKWSEKQYAIKKQRYENYKQKYPILMDEYNQQISKYNQELNLIRQKENELKDLQQQIKLQKTTEEPEQNTNKSKRSKEKPLTKMQQREKNLSKEIKKKKKLKLPKQPAEPIMPKKPDFQKNKQTIEMHENSIKKLNQKMSKFDNYYKSRDYDLVNPLKINNYVKISTCGTKGCVIQFTQGYIPHITDINNWHCDFVQSYIITIAHHVFHSIPSIKFKSIIKDVSTKFGMFVRQVGNYVKFESFGQLGYINVDVLGKELVIPFVKSVLDELEKSVNLDSNHELELPNTIISNIAISHPTNREYFIKLMRMNKIDITLDGSFVKGPLGKVRNVFNLINQRKIELIFPFLSIKIPKKVFVSELDHEIEKVNNSRAPNKQWVKIKSELVFPREDYNECKKIIENLTKKNAAVHGCLYTCEETQFSSHYLPVYMDAKTPVLRPFCVDCMHEMLRYATSDFFDLRRCSFSKEFLENNVEFIKPISICLDNYDQKTGQTWPCVPIAQLFSVLKYEVGLREMAYAWTKGVVEQSIRTCPFIVTCCPLHPQKKFLIGDNPISCSCPSCKLCFCVSCKSWHRSDELCEVFDKSLKRCPKCHVPVEKSDGCNHIQCKCGAHWCYQCGAGPFADGSKCYEHMTNAHIDFYH